MRIIPKFRRAALLVFVLIAVVMVEDRFLPGEDRDAPVVLDREGAYREDERNARYVARDEVFDADVRQHEVERTARRARHCVQLLAEDEGHFVDADVADDAAEDSRDDAEEDRAPPRPVAVHDRLLDADHHE